MHKSSHFDESLSYVMDYVHYIWMTFLFLSALASLALITCSYQHSPRWHSWPVPVSTRLADTHDLFLSALASLTLMTSSSQHSLRWHSWPVPVSTRLAGTHDPAVPQKNRAMSTTREIPTISTDEIPASWMSSPPHTSKC